MWSDDYGRDDDRNRRSGRGGDRHDQHFDPNDPSWRSGESARGFGRDSGYQGPQWNPIYGNQSQYGGQSAGRERYTQSQYAPPGYDRQRMGPEGYDSWQRSLGGRDDPYQRYAPPRYPDSRDGGESFGNPNDRERQGNTGSIWGGADSRYSGGQAGYPREWSEERERRSYYDDRRVNPRDDYRAQSWLESQRQYGPGWAETQNQRARDGWAQSAGNQNSSYFYERPNREYVSDYQHSSHQHGPHQGRGPKGWKRADDRIKEDINEQLSRHPHLDASEIEVMVEQGEVTLSGTVDDRYAKRMAEDVAEQVYGVTDVQNQIRVSRGDNRSMFGANSASLSDRDVSRPAVREGGSPDALTEGNARPRNAATGS